MLQVFKKAPVNKCKDYKVLKLFTAVFWNGKQFFSRSFIFIFVKNILVFSSDKNLSLKISLWSLNWKV
jgi:hypothetical protein